MLEEIWHPVNGSKYITLYCVTFHCIALYTQINKLIYSFTAYNAGHFLFVRVSCVEGNGSSLLAHSLSDVDVETSRSLKLVFQNTKLACTAEAIVVHSCP